MARPSLITSWIIIAAFLVQSVYAQNTEILSSQPVIHGEINGMKVIVQGDAVAFMAAGKTVPSLDKMDDESCAHDLHCTMQKNKTEAVVWNSEGLWIFNKSRRHTQDDFDEIVPIEPLLPFLCRLISTRQSL